MAAGRILALLHRLGRSADRLICCAPTAQRGIKGPALRGLAARAPYYHHGAAQDLNEAVNVYKQRLQMNLSNEEKSHLIAFLHAL
jgi:cytochrome c peroxidase